MKKFLLLTFAFMAMVMTAFADDVTVSWKAVADWTAEGKTLTLVQAPYTVQLNQANGGNVPVINENDLDARTYAKGTVTLSTTGANMTKIVFSVSERGKKQLASFTASAGEVVVDKEKALVTWSGDAKEVTLTVGDKAVNGTASTKAGQLCFSKVVISAGQGGGEVTPEPEQPVEKGEVFAESFGTNQGKFTVDNKVLPEAMKSVWNYDSHHYMKASAFVSKQKLVSESWLVSPVIDMTKTTNHELSFENVGNFFNGDCTSFCTVKVKAEGGEWTDLALTAVPDGKSWTWVTSTADLKAYDGKKIQIAFVYTSNEQVAGTWEVKNVKVLGAGVVAPEVPVYKTIAELKKNAAFESAQINYEFSNLLVTGVAKKNDKFYCVYVTDGVEGTQFYGTEAPVCKAGDKISGTLAGDLKLYNGLTEIENAEYAGVKVVSSNNEVAPKVLTVTDIASEAGLKAYENMFVTVENLTFAAEAFDKYGNIKMVDEAKNEIVLRDNFKVLGDFIINTGVSYNVTAFVSQYKGAAQLFPLTADDVKMITNLKEAETAWAEAEVALEAGAEWNVTNAFSTLSDAKPVFTSSNEAVATVDENGKVTVKGYGFAEIVAETAETTTYLPGKASFMLYVLEGKGLLKDAYTPADLQYYVDKLTEKAWVCGEIIGVYDNNKVVEGAATDVASNIALRLNGVTIPVQLSSKSDERAALNLVDNPNNLNRKVWVLGSIEKYFGVPGVKGLTGYSFDGITGIENVETENGSVVIYDLSGRRLAAPVKGFNIINGKKVLVK